MEDEVKNTGKRWGYVGIQGFKGFGAEPIMVGSLIGVEGFAGWVSEAVRGWKVGVDLLSAR